MDFIFKKLTQINALDIANNWKYDGIYSFYDMTADIEDYDEFINEELRNQSDYFEAIYNDELVGFFSVSLKSLSIEIGLGLKPDICGKGIGKEFLTQIMNYVDNRYPSNEYIMNVATFNQRAIKVYHSWGFEDYKVVNCKSNGGVYEFLTLIKHR